MEENIEIVNESVCNDIPIEENVSISDTYLLEHCENISLARSLSDCLKDVKEPSQIMEYKKDFLIEDNFLRGIQW